MNEQKQAEGTPPSAEDELRRLLTSRTIREVYQRRLSPKTLDKRVDELRQANKELKQTHQLDQSEIVRLRRQVEFLLGNYDV